MPRRSVDAWRRSAASSETADVQCRSCSRAACLAGGCRSAPPAHSTKAPDETNMIAWGRQEVRQAGRRRAAWWREHALVVVGHAGAWKL